MDASSLQWLNGLPAGAVWIAALSLLGIVVKQWLPFLTLRTEAENKRRGEDRDDLHECREEVRKLNERIDGLQSSFANLKIEMHGTLSAYRILDAEIEASNPGSLGLKQARAILSSAFTVAPSTAAISQPSPKDVQ